MIINSSRWQISLSSAAVIATLVLLYASIVPLNYQPLSWLETWERWAVVPWLDLSLYNRADWVANALVVIPSGFFALGACCIGTRSLGMALPAALLISASLCGLVIAIEFCQIWFPPRTVSQNDIFAGCIGAVLGPASWLVAGPTLVALLERFLTQNSIRGRLKSIAAISMLMSLLYTVFPLDLITSASELQLKLDEGRLTFSSPLSSLLQLNTLKGLILSTIRIAPLGLWLGLSGNSGRRSVLALCLVALLLELVQVPIFSKHASGWEFIAGCLGGIGAWWIGTAPAPVLKLLQHPVPWFFACLMAAIAIPIAMLARYEYIVGDPASLSERWNGLWTPPLLRYYYTSEYAALTNLAGKILLFACAGTAWAGGLWAARTRHTNLAFWCGLGVCGVLGTAIEIGQIYLYPLIADATDVFIYASGYTIGFLCTMVTLTGTGIPKSAVDRIGSSVNVRQRSGQRSEGFTWFRLGAVILFCTSLALAVIHPSLTMGLLVACCVLFSLTMNWPRLFFAIFPVALVTADGYLFTGQLVVQEYDALLLASAAGALWTSGEYSRFSQLQAGMLKPVLCLLGVITVGGLIGWFSLPSAPYSDQLSVYFTSWNALRIGKGYAWGGIFLVLLLLSAVPPIVAGRFFARGMQIALCYVGLVVALERLAFESLWDLSRELRTSGPFATMHIGDQHLDGFLALALPFAWFGLNAAKRSWGTALWASGLTGLAIYAAVASMSRGTIAALLLETSVLVMWSGWKSIAPKRQQLRLTNLLVGVAGLLVLILGASLTFRSQAISRRFQTTFQDAQGRLEHWSDCLNILGEHPFGILFGRGMGTIPTELAYDAQRPIAPLRITQQNEQPAIAFRPGWPIYLEHWIYVDGDRPLVVDATIASPDASLDSPSLLTATRCNKDLLQSYECVTDQIRLTSSQEQQIRFELPRIPSDRLENRWRSLRPQAISLSVGGKNVVTFANLSISNLQAEEVSAIPSDRPTGIEGAWIFTCDDHLAWRTKNAWVHMLFEHGLLGLIAAAWIQVVLIRRLLVAKQCAGIERPIVATALGGFAFIALFGTLVDTPWLCALMLSVGSLVCIDERTEHADLIVETS